MGRCRFTVPWCHLDLTFDLTVETLSFNILSGVYLKNHEVYEVLLDQKSFLTSFTFGLAVSHS